MLTLYLQCIGYVIHNKSEEVMDNSFHVQDCTFSNYRALYGGGTGIFANQGSQEFSEGSKLEFINCSWTNNTANLGMAVDIPINVVMDECPPGYVLHNTNTCICFSLTRNQHYMGIERCNNTLFQEHGHWVG